jgi:hypothetical protein
MFMHEWFTAMGTASLSLDNASRMWDVMVFEGDMVLVRSAAAFLTGLEARLFGAETGKEVLAIVKDGLDNIGEEEWMKLVRQSGK